MLTAREVHVDVNRRDAEARRDPLDYAHLGRTV